MSAHLIDKNRIFIGAAEGEQMLAFLAASDAGEKCSALVDVPLDAGICTLGSDSTCWGHRVKRFLDERRNEVSHVVVGFDGFFARRDTFGRIIFDTCPTMHHHLVDETQSDVRHLMDVGQFFPEDTLNKKGDWQISIAFIPEDEPV